MSDNFETALPKSIQTFDRFVKPEIMRVNPNWREIVCEGDKDELKRIMDLYSGIDLCLIDDEKESIQGVASRVQYDKCWSTFTVRLARSSGAKTEFEKRWRAINTGDLYPKWTIQAYIQGENVDIGMVETKRLYEYIANQAKSAGLKGTSALIEAAKNGARKIGDVKVQHTGEIQQGQAYFLVCYWDSMDNAGYPVIRMKR